MIVTSQRLKTNEIIELFNSLETDESWSFREYKTADTNKLSHGYHSYPAKFIPQLVEKIFDTYPLPPKAHINDPFYGSGTTIVTALTRGFRASGTDINKLAYLITKVKSTPIAPDYLEYKINLFIQQLYTKQQDIKPLIPAEQIDKIDYWFTEDIKNALGRILHLIYLENDDVIKNFYLVAFSNILKSCSLWAAKSLKPTRKLNKKPQNPYIAIKKQLQKMQKGNRELFNTIPPQVKEQLNHYLNIYIGDARQQPIDNETVDLIITSSPYVTSYEYADLHQLSLIWLFPEESLSKYKEKFIGTTVKKNTSQKPRSEIANSIVKQLSQISMSKAREIETFFVDMENVFDESYRILKTGGRCCFVIGNTRIKGIDILNAEVFTESLQYSGFEIEQVIKREILSKILPQKRDPRTGKFTSAEDDNTVAIYPVEYIIVARK